MTGESFLGGVTHDYYTGSLPPHKLHCGCPLIRCISTRLAVFGGYKRASRPSLSLAIDEALHQHLLSSTPSTRARTLALSSALPHAGDWLNGVPSAALGLLLHDREFRSCLRYWLGVPLHSTSYFCPECRSTADPFGDHQVGCRGNGDRISCHNAICDVLFRAAQSAALAPSREMPTPSPDQPTSSSLPGTMVVRLLWTFMSSHLFSNRRWERLHSPLAMPCRLVSNAHWRLTSQLADLRGWISSPS